jgi:hypothetical protein
LVTGAAVIGGLVTIGAAVVAGDELLSPEEIRTIAKIAIATARNAIARFFLLKVTVSLSCGLGGWGINCSDMIFP